MKESLIKMAWGALTIVVAIVVAQNVVQPMIDKSKLASPASGK